MAYKGPARSMRDNSGAPPTPPQWNQQPFFYPSVNAYQQYPPQQQPMMYPYQTTPPSYQYGYQASHYAQSYGQFPQPHLQRQNFMRYTEEGYGVSSTAPDPNDIPMAPPIKRVPKISEDCDCFTCNRQFPNKIQLIAHRAREHAKCPEPSCNFEADGPTLARHQQQKHSSLPQKPSAVIKPDGPMPPPGVAPRIEGTNIKLDTPEAIAKWIQDRKKRWPSASVIAQKAENAEARRAAPSSGSHANYTPFTETRNTRGGQRGRGRAEFQGMQRGTGWEGRGRGRGRGRGTFSSGPAASTSQSLLDQNPDQGEQPQAKRQKLELSVLPQQTGPSPNLGMAYGSSSSSDDEAPEELPTKASVAPSQSNLKQAKDASDQSDSSGEEDEITAASLLEARRYAKGAPSSSSSDSEDSDSSVRTEASIKPVASTSSNSKPTRRQNPKLKAQKQPKAPKAFQNPFSQRHSLLSKLLAQDVAHDVSDLLQAAEFLVRNDFLKDVEMKPGEADEAFGIEEMQTETHAT